MNKTKKIQEKIVFNHYYHLRHDQKRTYILSKENENAKVLVENMWISKVHPIYAMIFSFLSEPISTNKLYDELSYFLDIKKQKVEEMIEPLINNAKTIINKYGSTISIFPKNIIIKESELNSKILHYTPEQFAFSEIDLKQERIYLAPLNLLFVVNTNCFTNCAYCYADRKYKHNLLSVEKIKEIVRNAKIAGINNITISGGEFFLHKNWEEIMNILIEYDYNPGLISTKIPLGEEQILKIKTYNLAIQISLDSLFDSNLQEVLGVKSGYAEKISHSIKLLEKHNITYQIATVITKLNNSIENLEKIYDFIKDLKNMRRWEVRIVFRSLYSRGDFDAINVNRYTITEIDKYINTIKPNAKINISWDSSGTDRYFTSTMGSKGFPGGRCSANYCNMVILPDGKVTICEQLYWEPYFIIGDLTTQTIEEVWNSPMALKLANLNKDAFRDETICKSCKLFDDCISYNNRCVLDIVKAYGIKNIDYPDPRCAKAPKFINELQPI
ncbi:MAG: radical SAM protein [Prevotellaceae bacterium]|jgi:radical SAM protein with 4Fe4S-binding SPASM domain|nr:radical SAM protein [Prevotellaceae bacterium]